MIDIGELVSALQALGVPMSNKASNAVRTNVAYNDQQTVFADACAIAVKQERLKADGTTNSSNHHAAIISRGNTGYEAVYDAGGSYLSGATGLTACLRVENRPGVAASFSGNFGGGGPLIMTPTGTGHIGSIEGGMIANFGTRKSDGSVGGLAISSVGTISLPLRTSEPPKLKVPIARLELGSNLYIHLGRSDTEGVGSYSLFGIIQNADTFYVRDAYTTGHAAHPMKDVQYKTDQVASTSSFGTRLRVTNTDGSSVDQTGWGTIDCYSYLPYVELDNRRGMIALADRVTWDPASKGSGDPYLVIYNGVSWVALS